MNRITAIWPDEREAQLTLGTDIGEVWVDEEGFYLLMRDGPGPVLGFANDTPALRRLQSKAAARVEYLNHRSRA